METRNWTELKKPLSVPILDVIRKLKFEKMTPVQAATIPQLLASKDVVVEAITGSGKTLAFIIPLIELLLKRSISSPWKINEVGGIVISPTRELAVQTSVVLQQFLEHDDLKHFTQRLLVGGNSVDEDINMLEKQGGHILICTPGRLEDLLSRSSNLNLARRIKSLEMLVLDEADRLLDLGFSGTLNSILSYLPRQRRTGLFSATQTQQVGDLIRAGLRNPSSVCVTEKSSVSTPMALQNQYMLVEPEYKLVKLLAFIKENKVQKAMLFLPTCACVDYWSDVLPYLTNLPVLALHGKMKQKRGRVLDKFRKETKSLLLCTDVLARGVDIPEVDWVFQWDPPSNAAAFVHRVGRTARQGNEGNAIIMLLQNEEGYIKFINLNQKVILKETDVIVEENELTRVTKRIRDLQKKNRAIFEKGSKAFVSHIRAYSKHECKFLLRIKDLPLGKIATSYGLLKLPIMPEIKEEHKNDFVEESGIDYNEISYNDKQRESARLEKLKNYRETGVWPGKKIIKKMKKTEPWEQAKLKKLEKKEKRMKRRDKKKIMNEKIAEGDVKHNIKKRKKGFTEEDIAELAKDVALCKKLKKKKITEEEFDKEMGLDVD